MGFNVAIDGPAGSGKSTVARKAAEKLHFLYVDTGAMYRAIGLCMHREGLDLEDEAAVSEHIGDAHIDIRYDEEGQQRVLLNGEDVTPVIRDEKVGAMASAVSRYPAVRNHLTSLQRELAAENDVFMDGRDIGTCILPDAGLKIYLTADPSVRAERRVGELAQKGIAADFEKIREEIIARDWQDMHRETAPLKQAEDAVKIDTSSMTIQEVTDRVVALTRERMAGKAQ
ncbi:MAG: (d)CMP kinase [Lachnospiraceae bacterium]|jgi:cytidylate kinase